MRRGARLVAGFVLLFLMTRFGEHAGGVEGATPEQITGRETGQGSFCAYTPEVWQRWCRSRPQELKNLCRELKETASPELAALKLNVAASEKGVLPPGLAELRFRGGPWAAYTLGEWVSGVADAGKKGLDLEQLAAEVNRNFGPSCGDDLGALAPDEVLPLCYDPSQRIRGARGSTCGGLSSECAVGFLDEAMGCCDLDPRPFGIACGEGGTCDGAGSCLPPSELKMAYEPAVFGDFRGTEHWVNVVGDGQAGVWSLKDGVRISVDERKVADLFGKGGFDLSEVHVATTPPESPFGAVAVSAPSGWRRFYVPRLLDDEPPTVCAVAGLSAWMAPIRPDCSSDGAVALSCPGQSGDFSCVLDDFGFAIEGPEIAIGWERYPAGDGDMRPLFYPLWPPPGGGTFGDGGPIGTLGCSPACRLGQLEPCRNSCGDLSFKTCNPTTGCFGPCRASIDICDNHDNDCDGLIDEGGRQACDDGLPCTIDSCQRLPLYLGSPPGLAGDPFDVIRAPGIEPVTWVSTCRNQLISQCRNPTACTFETCSFVAPEEGLGETVVRNDEYNYCWEIRDNSWCTGVWDSCDCNGREMCLPGADGADEMSGCIGIDRYPCDTDDNLCTQETCCEQNEGCRFGTADREILGMGCTDLPGSLQPRFPGDTERVYCVDRTEVFGERTWREVRCDDGNPCTTDECDPATGGCEFANRPASAACVGPSGRRTTGDGCGEYRCAGLQDGVAQCIVRENERAGRVDCPAEVVPTPGGEDPGGLYPLTRKPFSRVDEPVTYLSSDGLFEWQSCHRAGCVGGHCGVKANGDCPPDDGCVLYSCTSDPYENAGGIRGCQSRLDTNVCWRDGDLPENTCLVPRCSGIGSERGVNGCTFRPDPSRCSIPESCDGSGRPDPSRRYCNTDTGQCAVHSCPF